MLLSLAFLLLLLPCHSQQTTAHEKKTQAEHSHRSPLVNLSSIAKPSDASSQRTSKKEESPSPAQHPIKVLISNSWIQKDTTTHTTNSTLVQSKELDLERGSPLLLTHQINLVPGACGGCEAEFATLRERLDHLEREVSTLKENCVGAEGAACFLRSDGNECPNDCSDQGRCEGGKCVCFPGFKGHDCGSDVCPSDCSGNGQCVNGQCVCDNGYSGLDCANKSCPGNCNNQGQCAKGKCVCHHGFTGTDCSTAPSGSVHLQSRDITDSSVTLFWTQPSAQYNTYHITFKSQREGDTIITAKVGGRLTSFTQTRLAAGQKYKVSIKGERDGKMGPESNTEFTTAPSGSVHIRSRDVTESSVTLFWTQPSVQYSTYHITLKSQKEGDEMRTVNVGGRLTSFTQTGLAAGQKYRVSIKGERDGKMGPESNTEFTTAPSGSVHIQSRDVTESSVTVFWTQPSVQYSAYHITFKSQTEGDETITAKVGGRFTSFTQTGLAAGQKYKVSIRGERDGKMGPWSTTEFTTAPSGSVHIRSRDVTDSSVTLFWTQPSVQYSTYHITFKSQTEGDEMITAKVGGRLTSFTQTGLAAGRKYKVSIRGERDGKMGPESNTEFSTAPSGSVHLQSRDVTESSVTLFWTQPSVQYSTYHITFKSQRDGDEIIPANVGGRLTSFTQPGLAAGQKYKVSIKGERDGKMGPESNTEFTTAPSGSVHIRSRDVTDSSATVSWTQPSVQYSTYHITFKSQREGDEKITAKVGGRVFSFAQTRLDAGQKYKVSIRGERDGKMGPESTTEFTTSPSGSVYIRSRDVTEYSVTLFWTQPSVQYSSYHITFKSQREGGEMITAKVGGRLTSFTQTRLAAGQKYKVSIRGERDGKMGPESTTEFTTAPSGSVHLRSRDITDSSVALLWTQPSVQYSTYHITFKSQRDGDEKITAKVGGRVFSFTQTRLAAGQKYKVSIRGERDGNMGPESTIEFTTSPSGSVHLRSRDITDSSVTLFWTHPSIQYSTYHITFKSQREGNKMITAKVGGHFTSFTQSGLAASETYKVLIRGERDGKMGPESTTEFTTAPSGSVHLRSRDVTESSVTLFWAQSSVQYSTYHITFNSQRVGEKIITAKVGGRLTSFTQTGLAAGQKYKVSIRGERDGKMGPESTTEFSTVPIGSVHLQSRAIADSSVTLFWTQPSVQYSTYHITFKSQREGDEMITGKVGGRLTSFTQTGLAAGQKYKVSIRGERDGKMGPESNTEFTTAGSLYLRSRDITASTVTLSWTQPSVQYSTYHITFKSQREGDKMITNKVGGRISSFTQTGLAAGQKYKVSIRGERDGKMGPESTTEFTTALSGSIYFHTRDATESSITLFWAQPSVQYSTYHITFKSQREGDELITAKVGGRLTSFTQTGLASGQKYKVSIKGERDGKMGPESNTEFTTAPSGSVHIRSRDVTDSSVTIFWTQPSVQYSAYHITFKSLGEGDEKITSKVGGRVFSFTQTRLAAGQKYKVSIRGERDGNMGPERTIEFTTSPSGSVHIQSRDVTESSVTLFWTQPSVQYSTYHITFKSQREGDEMITAKVGGRLTSFTQSGLAGGQKYKVSIKGERDGKMGPESNTEFTTAPSGSVHIWSRDITDSSVTFFWTQPSVQYSTYHITFKSQREGDETITAKVGGRLTSFTQTGLAAGQKYKVSIKGERDGKMGPESNTEFTTAGSLYLRSRDITESTVTLSWTQPSVQYSTYHITFKSQREGDEMITAKVGGRLTSFTQTGLAAGQKYKVSIRGERDGKMGPDSNTEFTTAGSLYLRSSDITESTVTLSWTQPSVQYSTYHITFKSQREGDKMITNKVGGRISSFTQTGLAAGQKYKVSIRGERGGKMGQESMTEFTTALSGSIYFHIRDETESSITLFWTPPSIQYSTYHITFKSQREGDEIITAKVGGRLTNFTQSGLAAGQKYKVSIKGERDGKMGPESNTEFTTAPSSSVHIRSRDVTDSSVTVFWTQPSVQYSTYHITFKSLREGDEKITAKVGGRVFSFTQTRLAAGQKYKVSIRGERDGNMGPERTIEFTTSPSGSVHIQSSDVTESSVTLFWTQPSVQYSTYHITFKSQREGDEMITAKVGGRLTSFTQTGLAAGQKYKVSIRGERDGKMGPDRNTEFTTAPSGSVHLRSRAITDSSVTLFWTQPSVQYSTYHITLKSQREADEMITAKVGGRLTSFTQIGLVAGQKYKVSIKGEIDWKMGPESTTEFTTAGSLYLRSRDITESTVTLSWTQPSIQYSTYHITFKSQREGDKMITNKVGGRISSFTQTGLAAGQKYKVSIRGERDGKMGPESTIEFTTAVSGSIYFHIRDVTESSITLFWTQPSIQYSTYHITFKSQREGDEIITAKVEGRLTSFTQSGLAAGQKYKVSIKGERDGKMGPESNTEFTTAPSGYVHIRSRDVTDSSVTVFWTKPSVQYSTYHITFKSQREGDKIITNKVGGRISSFTQTGLAAGQKYKVSIRGERDGKMGPESNTEFTTSPSGSVHIQSRDITESSVNLFWTQPSVQYSTYHITFKSQREGDEMIAAKVGGRLTSFTQTGLAAGQKYKVSIRGERDGKMGPESNTEFTTAPSGSVHLRSRDITDSSVTLFWTQPSVQYSTYHITFKSQREGDEMITAKVGGRLTSFTQTGLVAGQKYKVSIKGEIDGKMGPESTTEFTTAGSLYLRSSDITESTVTLSWTQPSVQYSTYHITFKSQREGDKMITNKVGGRISRFTQTGLAAGQKYKVSIRGERDGKMGQESMTEFTTAPSGSIYFQTRAVTESSITLFWIQPSVQYSTYHITFKSQREGDKIITNKVGGRISRFTQTGLAAGQKYKVSIRGERDGKMGQESMTEFTTAPSGSIYFQTRAVTESSITLFWIQPSVQYSTYHITFKSQREGDKIITNKVGGRISSFTQTGLAAGQKYKVSIRGERGGKMGPESNMEFTTAPSGSIYFHTRDVTESSITLFWTQPSVQYSTYHIAFKSQRQGDKMIAANIEGRLTSITQTGLAAGQKYKVSIRGERDGKMGPESTTEFSTAPSGSVHLRSRDVTESSVTLFWTQPSVQYSTYHITFKSQKEGDKMLTEKIEGRLTSFTQTGLAAGQKYKVSIRGERDGKMGPESTTEFTAAPSGSILIRSRDVTESSVTLFWTQPSVQYSTYHITFKSQKEGDEKIAAKVRGRLTSFTQTGLTAGQKYKVSIRGERDGKMGPESTTEFGTDISGPRNLNIFKTTPTSVLVQWESPMGDIDSYRLSISPSLTEANDRKKEGQETTLPPDTDAANIDGLEEGHLYDITLIALKGRSQSRPIRIQAVPGNGKKVFNKIIVETVTAKRQPEGDISTEKKASDKTTLDKTLFLKTNEEGQIQHKEKISRTGDDSSKTKQGTYLKTDVTNSHGRERTAVGSEVVTLRTTSAGGGTGGTAQGGRRITSQTLLKQGATRGQEEWTKVTRPDSKLDSKHHSKVLPNPDLKTPGTKSTKTVEGQREAHGTVVANTSGLEMHSTSVKVNTKSTDTKVELNKSDSTSGHKTSGSEGDVTIAEGRKATGPRKSWVTQVNGTERIHGSLGNGTTRSSTWTGSWKSGVENGTGQTYVVKQRVDSSWNVTGTLRTVSTTDSGPVVVERKGVLKTGGATKANRTVSEKVTDNNTKQVSQKGNVTKTEFSHNMATVQVMQGQSEDRKLGTGGIRIVTQKIDTSIIRKGNQRVQSSYDAIQIDTATQISSRAPFRRNHTSSSKTRHTHGKIGHNDTSSQTGLNATMKLSSHHKNTSKTDIPQTDIPSNKTRNLGSALNSVEVRNITSSGFIIIWEAPRGMFQSFVVTRTEYGLGSGEEQEEEEEDIEEEQGEEKRKVRVSVSENGGRNITDSHSKSNNSTSVRVSGTNVKKVSQVIPGNARSLTFRNLLPQTRYSLTMFGMGSGLQSKIHHFTITTGPESPSELLFSNVTDSSLSVSWTKPKSPITGFKITYTHTEDGESTSVSVDAKHSSVTLSQLSPGSSYEVIVVSVLGLKESDPVNGLVITAPDPPTGLRAVNVTDTKALLVWKPALATVDRYIIIFGSEKMPAMTVKVSGNNAEHQLKGLHSGTVYTVTVTSQLDSLQSTRTTTTFTTSGSGIRREEVPQEMTVSQVTPRSVVLSWKSPNMAVTSYRLTYQRAGQRAKEVILASTVTKFKLTGLSPSSKYTLRVQGERNGRHIAVIATEFKTGSLRFPFPTDCSQELLNGMRQSGEVEVFPAGRHGRPVLVYCDMETDGGGWTVFQRRMNGETNFFRGWSDYSYGFGNLSREFWLGNEHIHNLTVLRPMALRVDLHAGAQSYAHYSFFYIDGQRKHYALRVSGYSGIAGDSMRYYNGRPFSTHDKDPLPFITNGATSYRGGWWHKNCHKANMNGLYNTGTTHQGVIWTDWKGQDFSIPFTEMKLRPASFPSRTHS